MEEPGKGVLCVEEESNVVMLNNVVTRNRVYTLAEDVAAR